MNNRLSELNRIFEEFERDINILESLESELKHLDTYGFEKEVRDIKVLLKDTSKIQSIKLKLRELRKKIEKPEIKKENKDDKKGKGGGKVITVIKGISGLIKEKQRQKGLKRKEKFEKKKEVKNVEEVEKKTEYHRDEDQLSKEKIDMIEEKVEDSFNKHTNLKVFNKPDKGIRQRSKPKINDLKDKSKEKIINKMPSVSELVQRTKDRFVKNNTGINQDKSRIINQLKEQYISRPELGLKSESSVEKFNQDFFRIKSEPKPKLKLKQSFGDVLEKGNNVQKPLLEPKIEKEIVKSKNKDDIIESLKDQFKTN
jgi:hypothetical protein